MLADFDFGVVRGGGEGAQIHYEPPVKKLEGLSPPPLVPAPLKNRAIPSSLVGLERIFILYFKQIKEASLLNN